MIKITRLNKTTFFLNSELIETVESTPDTVITTTEGRKYIVLESADEIIEKIIVFKANINKKTQEIKNLFSET